MTLDQRELSELLTLLKATEYLAEQEEGTPAPQEGTPEYAHRGQQWDYVSSTPAPENAELLTTASDKEWWRLQPQQDEEEVDSSQQPLEFKEFIEATTPELDKNPELVAKVAQIVAQDREQALGSEHTEGIKNIIQDWVRGQVSAIQGVRAVLAQMRGEEIDREAVKEVVLSTAAKSGVGNQMERFGVEITEEFIDFVIESGLIDIGAKNNPDAVTKLIATEQKYAEKKTRELFGDTITVYRAFRGPQVKEYADRIADGETVEMNVLPGTAYSTDAHAPTQFSIQQHASVDWLVWKQEIDASEVLSAWYSNPSFLTGHETAQPYQKEVIVNPKNTSITLTKDDFTFIPAGSKYELTEEERREQREQLFRLEDKRNSIADKDQAIKELSPEQYGIWLDAGVFFQSGRRLTGKQIDAFDQISDRINYPEQYEGEDEYDLEMALDDVWDGFPELSGREDWDSMWEIITENGIKQYGEMSPIDKKVRRLEEDSE